MNGYQVRYTKRALKDLEELPKVMAKHIVEKITFFRKQKNPLNFAKKLKSSKFGTYRFRIGSYRAIFDIDKQGNIQILLILTIKHRKEVYRGI